MATDTLARLDADRLTAFIRRRCAWCGCSTASQRRDAHYCTTAHRCRAWRHRKALESIAAQLRLTVTTDHRTSQTEGPNP